MARYPIGEPFRPSSLGVLSATTVGAEVLPSITERTLYRGFGATARFLFRLWRNWLVRTADDGLTRAAMESLDKRLAAGNAIVFFDHHYAFDALPTTLALANSLQNMKTALVPYAVYLDMGVDPKGQSVLYRRWRTKTYRWLVGNIERKNPGVHTLPVAREFELDTPALKRILERDFQGVNTRYTKRFTQLFSHQRAGLACILAPMGGLAFPGRPEIHPKVFKLLAWAQKHNGGPLPSYLVSAYPDIRSDLHYSAPLLSTHTFYAQGPFELPRHDCEAAREATAEQLYNLRSRAGFEPPNDDRLREK